MNIECPNCQTKNPEDSKYCTECETSLFPPDETLSIHPEVLLPQNEEFIIGSTIVGKYTLIEKLGSGGWGVVYKAEDLKLKRHIALKFLSPRLTRDPEYKLLFVQEAQAASMLEHQNICTVHEIDETEEGQMYIAMAYYPGETLKKKIKRGPIPLDDIIDILIQIAQGLVKAHSKGIIHRDIKPSNVMITGEGIMKIVDFGLAKLSSQTELTSPVIMGTTSYMSPEQSRGEDVGFQTDLWSLGVLSYELLTAELPFKGENIQAVFNSIKNESPISPTELRREIPEELEYIILKSLRKKQNDRYQSAEQMLSDLTKFKKTLEMKEFKDSIDSKKKPEIKKETERRQATVMHAEISGYLEILEHLEAEEAATMMNQCFAMFGRVIEKYDGHINKIVGGSLLAQFGVPEAIENAPKKAINAAIELRNSLYQFNNEKNLQIPLDIHIGINTGMVIAGVMDAGEKKEFSLLGDPVNHASYLKDKTAKGQIYIGFQTYRSTKNEFKYKQVAPIILKDRKKPLHVFELLSVKEKIYRSEFRSDRMIHSEMVGRTDELQKLELHVLKSINNEGSIVSIIGEAGIGKSRLIAELMKIEPLNKVTLLEGRALSIGKNLSFHPLIDVMKNWSGIKEEDSTNESIRKLENAINNTYPEGVQEVFPFIATLMGMKLTGKYEEGEGLEKLILKNLRELILKMAEQSPLVFIIEDLHWADKSSIETLRFLFRLAESNRILFINVLRPNYKETGDFLLKTIRSRYGDISTEMVLESLSGKLSEELISNLLKIKDLPAAVRNLIIKKAEGNPFFIEEIVRSFIDDGLVEFKNGQFLITGKIDSAIIPETISEMLMVRIDKLDEEKRSLLKVASVVGRNFFYKILAKVSKSGGDLDDELEFLKKVQLIIEGRRMDELEYLFKHALAQEAVYNSILLKKRKKLHHNVAFAIESVFHERLPEFFGLLAFHFSLAEDLDKAEEYLIKAGEEALKSSASNEALHYFQEGLKIYLKIYGEDADPEKVAMIEKNIAFACFAKGQLTKAIEYFDRVLFFYGEHLPKKNLKTLFKFLSGFINFFVTLYFPLFIRIREPTQEDKEIISIYEKKIRALAIINPKRMFVEIFIWLRRLSHSDLSKIDNGVGLYLLSSGVFCYSGISFRVSRKILEHPKDKIDKNNLISLLYYRLSEEMHYILEGSWEKIADYDETLLEGALRSGDLWAVSAYCAWHGILQVTLGNYEVSQNNVNRLDYFRNMYEDEFSQTMSYTVKIKQLWKYRKFNEALTQVNGAIKHFKNMGYPPYLCYTYSYKAQIELIKDEIDEAEKSLHTAENYIAEGQPAPMLHLPYFLGRMDLYIYKLEQAKKNLDKKEFKRISKAAKKTAGKAKKFSRKVSFEFMEVHIKIGIFYWLRGKQKKALKHWSSSIKNGKKFDEKPELSRTYFEVGKRLLEDNSRYNELDGIKAVQYLEKAKTLFTKMNLEWDIEELSKVKRNVEGDS